MRKFLVLILAFSILAGSVFAVDAVYASSDVDAELTQEIQIAPQQQGRTPDANLPFLFAVFIITWAAFFVYIFFISRRQREMQREIDALTRALIEKEREASESESPQQVEARASSSRV